jgi:hypothetical protein
VVLTLGVCIFGYLSYGSYKRLVDKPDQEPASSAADVPALEPRIDAPASRNFSRVLLFGGMFFASVVGLGLLLGHDVSQYIGSRAVKALYNDEGAGTQDPEYEQAEQVWADGHHLEAIRLMREYLQKNPREQYVALRIAEIYEKDLQNHLAAALEYEEVLKSKLPGERWGWSAIHLCNLYLKLGHQDKAIALLRRIDAEYGETQAAEKARQRLALYQADAGIVPPEPIDATSDPAPPAPPPPDKHGLPPGFRPRKA